MQANDTTAVVGEAVLGKKLPKVSVCVVTYNQEKYIAQCLQSIVDQETDFDFEIIVGDDCSTDKTRKIVQEFSDKYPGKFRLLFHPQNIGAAFNYAKTHELAAGEYVAHMDGDDLMLSSKLQKQVNALSENPNCVMVSHDMLIINANDSINKRTFKKHKSGINTIWDLYQTLPFFAHSSKMVRRDVDSKVLKIIKRHTLDIELHVEMLECGSIYHIDESLGIYRVGTGISASVKKSVNPILIEGCQKIFDAAIKKYPERAVDLRKFNAKAMLNYAYQAALYKNKKQVNALSKKSISIHFFSIVQILFVALPLVIVFFLVGLRNAIRHRN